MSARHYKAVVRRLVEARSRSLPGRPPQRRCGGCSSGSARTGLAGYLGEGAEGVVCVMAARAGRMQPSGSGLFVPGQKETGGVRCPDTECDVQHVPQQL